MSSINRLYFFLTISILLIILDYFGQINFIKAPADNIIKPIKKTIYSTNLALINFRSIILQYPHMGNMQKQLDEMKKNNDELSLKAGLLQEENNKLRKQLEAPLPSSYGFIPAQVVGVSRYMELASGAKENIAVGMSVIDGSVLIGKVISVTSDRSLVRLVSDPETVVPVRTSRGGAGVITGQAGGGISLTKILQKVPLFLDDLVVTSGEENFPPNLLIGKVGYIVADDTSPYKQAKVNAEVNYNTLTTVFVIIST